MDPDPFLANLFLTYYEIHWIKHLQRTDYGRARKYNNNFRFIDDLGTINNRGKLQRSHNQIYPEELLLNKENEVDTNLTLLNIEIKIECGRFGYYLYDTRDNFEFSIVHFPFKSSKMPSKCFCLLSGRK